MNPQPEQPEPAGFRLAPGVVLPDAVVSFQHTLSSGPGGQNVNKRATRVQLRVALDDLPIPADAKRRLARILGSMLTGEGEILIAADETRSQKRNQQAAVDRLAAMVQEALVKPKPRRKTKPSKGAIQRRIDEKKRRGETKRRRQGPDHS